MMNCVNCVPNVDDVFGSSLAKDTKMVMSFLWEVIKDAFKSFAFSKPVTRSNFWEKMSAVFDNTEDNADIEPQTEKKISFSIDWNKIAMFPKNTFSKFVASDAWKLTKEIGGLFGAAFKEGAKGIVSLFGFAFKTLSEKVKSLVIKK